MITNSPTFCAAPWTSIRIGTNDCVGFCTVGRDFRFPNKSIEENLEAGFDAVVTCIANGEWHSSCEYCKNAETKGGRSIRLQYNKNTSNKIIKQIAADPSVKMLTDASINLSNLCNLTCNYCTPEISSAWARVVGESSDIRRMDNTRADYLLKNSQNLNNLIVGGGEPLLQKEINSLLGSITHKMFVCVATNLSVNLETNPMFNTIINNKNLDVEWMISFDNTGDKFEYVRHGASWDLFCRNIELLKKHQQRITAHPVYCLYNALELKEYAEFCASNDLPIFFCDLFEPKELDVRYAPSSLRQLAIDSIDSVINHSNIINAHDLLEYKKMAVTGDHFTSGRDDSDSTRAASILQFNNKIENTLPKQKKFSELWPEIHNELVGLS